MAGGTPLRSLSLYPCFLKDRLRASGARSTMVGASRRDCDVVNNSHSE